MFFLEFVGQPASPREKSALELWSGPPRIGQNKPVAILQQMRPDTAAATFDYRQQHAGRWPAEANTTALGFRANLGVADDLFGSREDAYSETVRQKRWDRRMLPGVF